MNICADVKQDIRPAGVVHICLILFYVLLVSFVLYDQPELSCCVSNIMKKRVVIKSSPGIVDKEAGLMCNKFSV